MQSEGRALVVAAEFESTELRDRLLSALHICLVYNAAKLAHALKRRLHVLHLEEYVGSRPRVAAIHPPLKVRCGDGKPLT